MTAKIHIESGNEQFEGDQKELMALCFTFFMSCLEPFDEEYTSGKEQMLPVLFRVYSKRSCAYGDSRILFLYETDRLKKAVFDILEKADYCSLCCIMMDWMNDEFGLTDDMIGEMLHQLMNKNETQFELEFQF